MGKRLESWTVSSDVEPISADLVEGIVVLVLVVLVVVPFLACQMFEE